jgi:hypothetical protein
MADKKWESRYPNPDPQALFNQLNKEYFQNKIRNVEVKWSARMTVCAGICQYNGKRKNTFIHLSKPLLSLRNRRDMVETLLVRSFWNPNSELDSI